MLDPAPRVAILHALSDPSVFGSRRIVSRRATGDEQAGETPRQTSRMPKPVNGSASSPSTPSRTRRRVTNSPSPLPTNTEVPALDVNGGSSELERYGGDLQELQTLWNLWRGAGKSVNLWDWLEGFRGSMSSAREGEDGVGEELGRAGEEDEDPIDGLSGRKRKRPHDSPGRRDNGEEPVFEKGGPGQAEDEDEDEEEKQTRLHATFVRFCEEARMLGLVRARGRGVGRRGDEVVKGIGLV